MKMIKIKNKINKINKLPIKISMENNNMKYLFSFPFIFYNLDINVNDSDPTITQFAYGMLIISLVAFFCYINIAGYIIVIYLIQKK
jgi:hypothetical protein